MPAYRVNLIDRKEVAEGTMAFYFEKPPNFNFIAGQHAVFALINPPETDSEGNRRVFCFASAPYEEDLMIAMRMRDTAFKRVLKTLPVGSEIAMDGPYGSFVLHNDATRPAVFLAGGIGITPVRSMLFQAKHDNLPHTFYFFYSNRTRKDAAFLEEFASLLPPPSAGGGDKFIPVMTEKEGYIDRAKLTKHLDGFAGKIYYIVGPPGFVFAMRGMLNTTGVDAQDIRIDQFAGY